MVAQTEVKQVWERVPEEQRKDNRSTSRQGRPVVSKDELMLRREIAHGLSARGLTPGQIAKRLLADPGLCHLLKGYNIALYRVIQTDLVYYQKRLQKALADSRSHGGALEEYVARLDAILEEAWKRLESDAVLGANDVDTLLNRVQYVAREKAKALGVDTEGVAVSEGDGEGGTTNNNLIFTDPTSFLEFMRQVKSAGGILPENALNADRDPNTIEASAVEVS